jgi:hypothetical protein
MNRQGQCWAAVLGILLITACSLTGPRPSPQATDAGSAFTTASPWEAGQSTDSTQRSFPREAGAPRLFFTDLESGPSSGGQDGLGAFVTLYGEGLGPEQGDSTITLEGQPVARVVLWGENNAFARGLDQIVVQIDPQASSGDLVVTVGGQASNPLPFAVHPGSIYFVSTAGSDGNDGSFENPWATVPHARDSLAPGDIVYVMDGVSQIAEDNYGAALALETSGLPGQPMAVVAYPGATATIGSTSTEFGLRVPNNSGTLANDWVLAGLVLRGQVQAVDIGGDGSSRWRVVGNDISCPTGDGQTGCFAAALASDIAFFGNEVHDISRQGNQPSKQYHAVYFTTDTNHVEVGWSDIHDNRTCRAIQFHSSPLCAPDCGPSDTTGYNQYDLSVHDNWIQGDACDGINFATVDPSQGPVRAFNNVIIHVGAGPHPPDGDSNYACIYVAGGTNTGPDGTGAVEIFNNTCYDFGSVDVSWSAAGAFARGPGSPDLVMDLRNNIVYGLAGQAYLTTDSNTSLITGTGNLWFGNGPGPSFLTGNVEADPLFQDLAAFDFHLQPASPAIDVGGDTGYAFDFVGLFRPQGSAYDIGAFEFRPTP